MAEIRAGRSGVSSDRDREIARLREEYHRELMRKSLRIAELELMLKDMEAQYAESLSWRLTRPLRVAARVRGLFARGPRPTR